MLLKFVFQYKLQSIYFLFFNIKALKQLKDFPEMFVIVNIADLQAHNTSSWRVVNSDSVT